MKDNREKIRLQYGVICMMILTAVACRFLPFMHNFSPLAAIGLFGAAHFQKRSQAVLIPLAAAWVSDLGLNNFVYTNYYPEFTWFSTGFTWIYASYILIVMAGMLILRKVNTQRVLLASLSATAIFFVVTNIASWPGNPLYPQNISGMFASLAAGIPCLLYTSPSPRD